MHGRAKRKLRLGVLVAALQVAAALSAHAAGVLPELRAATRADAAALLCESSADPGPCVRASVERGLTVASPLASRRAFALLGRGLVAEGAGIFVGPDDVPIRFSTDPGSTDRVDPADGDGKGTPDVVEAVARGIWQARGLLIRQLELTRPEASDVQLVELGDQIDGYVWRGPGARSSLMLDATPREGVDGARRAAARLYARSVALASFPALAPAWTEAFATWTLLAIDRTPDAGTRRALSRRIAALHTGLAIEDPALGSGNALWLAFVEESYGLYAVRWTLEELARPQSLSTALDRALRRAAGVDLATAFRDFHLWSVLVGERSTGQHFRFAGSLDTPGFGADREGLPALSVHEAPPIAPLGGAVVRVVPRESEGGLRLRFEGDYGAAWGADLLIVGMDGTLHRVPLALSSDGRGEVTIPLREVREAFLLPRNLETVDGAARPYSFTAYREKGFPFEMVSVEARWIVAETPGVLVSWETASERQLVGFNIVRESGAGDTRDVVNPVWVPALGSSTEPTSYHFLDPTADPALSYVYRVEGITADGLITASDPVTVGPRSGPR